MRFGVMNNQGEAWVDEITGERMPVDKLPTANDRLK